MGKKPSLPGPPSPIMSSVPGRPYHIMSASSGSKARQRSPKVQSTRTMAPKQATRTSSRLRKASMPASHVNAVAGPSKITEGGNAIDELRCQSLDLVIYFPLVLMVCRSQVGKRCTANVVCSRSMGRNHGPIEKHGKGGLGACEGVTCAPRIPRIPTTSGDGTIG